MNKQHTKKKRSGSLFLKTVNMLTEYLYSIFKHGKVGDVLSTDNYSYQNSYTGYVVDKIAKKGRGHMAQSVATVFEENVATKLVGAFRTLLASLSFNVYGIFFAIYGLTAVFMHYISQVTRGYYIHDFYAVITAAMLIFCSFPMLTSSKSISQMTSESRIVRKLALSFLGFPEENLKYKNAVGGIAGMFISAGLAAGFGALTYFWHPSYFLIAFGVVVVLCIIFANPESGVVLTVMAAPFLQYTEYADLILALMVGVTAVSFICKVIRRRRIVIFSAEEIILVIFCGFIIVASSFSVGGSATFLDALKTVLIIFGGFFLTYNLTKGENRLEVCTRLLTVSFIALCVSGLWYIFYHGIIDGFVYSIREDFSHILLESNDNFLYLNDSVSVFSVLSVLVFPLLYLYIARSKNVRQFVALGIVMLMCAAASFAYGTYEAVVAIAVELVVFFIMWSHRSLSALIFVAAPILTIFMLYHYAEVYWGWSSPAEILETVLPANDPISSSRSEIGASISAMIADGNQSGIGAGSHAYQMMLPQYANAVSRENGAQGNLYWQIICWSGIGGLVAFLAFFFILLKKSLGYLMLSRHKKLRGAVLALFCSMSVALAFGLVNCLWTDVRMLYLFWVCAGLLAGYIREGREIRMRADLERCDAFDSKDVRVNLR